MNSDASDTARPDPAAAYEELRTLAYEEPQSARRRFLELLAADQALASAVLEHASGARDSRLRQVVARAVAKMPERDLIAEHLERWAERETDEFTSAAIKDALASSGLRNRPGKRLVDPLADLEGTYRYVTSRLRHRTLNALPMPGVLAHKLRKEAGRLLDAETYAKIAPILDDLTESLHRVEALADFEEDARHFEATGIRLYNWIDLRRSRFMKEIGNIEIQLDFAACGEGALVYATAFWLDLVFNNLVKNSYEATGPPRRILFKAVPDAKRVRIVVIDDGPGLAFEDQERAFSIQYSSKGINRGRGHMEVADAMRRMQGTAKVTPYEDLGFRVQLAFRREN